MNHAEKAWYLAVLISWGIAAFEYLLQVPANRIGNAGGYSFAELKIMQEAISLTVFVPIVVFWFREPLKWNYFWASLFGQRHFSHWVSLGDYR